MRVSFNSFPNDLVNQLGGLMSQQSKLQTQVSSGQRIKLAEDDPNGVDHYARSSIISVAEGALVCTLVEPSAGTPGRNVYGRTVMQRQGRKAVMNFNETITPGELPNQMLARIGGKLNVAGFKCWLSPLLTIQRDVDFQVGNVDFDGDVLIRGDVLDLFQVQARRGVVVQGLIEGARIECGGDLTVAGGIAGKQKAVLSVGGKLRARFIDNATVNGTCVDLNKM